MWNQDVQKIKNKTMLRPAKTTIRYALLKQLFSNAWLIGREDACVRVMIIIFGFFCMLISCVVFLFQK